MSDMKDFLKNVDQISEAVQLRIAETIRQFPDTPLYTADAVRVDPDEWALTYVESLKYADYARYLEALSWFYTPNRPTDSLSQLIKRKLNVIGRGKPTTMFWDVMSEALEREGL